MEGKTYTGKVSFHQNDKNYSFQLEMDGEVYGSIHIDFSYQTEGMVQKETIKPIIELEDFAQEDLSAAVEKFMSNEALQSFILENVSLFGDLSRLLEFIPNQA